MSEIIIFQKNSSDRILSVNAQNELVFTVKGEKTEVIYKNVSGDFDALFGCDGTLHVVIVSLAGSLLYLTCRSNVWKKYTVLESRGGGKKINAVRLLYVNGAIHAFYCIEYEGRMMLVHHVFDGTNFSREPHVADYVSLRCAYCVCADSDFNLHILYAGEDSRLKYIKFTNSRKSHTAVGIELEDEIRAVNVVCLRGGLYAAYLSREREYNVINCVSLASGEKHTVGFGVGGLSEPCIFTDGEKIYVQWCEKGYAFECTADGDFKFQKPISLGQTCGTVRLRGADGGKRRIDGCAGTPSGRPFPSAKRSFDESFGFEAREFKNEAAATPYASAGTDYALVPQMSLFGSRTVLSESDVALRLSSIERRLDELIRKIDGAAANNFSSEKGVLPHLGDVGEINEENLKIFKAANKDKFTAENGAPYEQIRGKTPPDREKANQSASSAKPQASAEGAGG